MGRLRYRFWLWLFNFARERCNESYTVCGVCNLRCPACQTWTAETGGPLKVEEHVDRGFTVVWCGQCGVANSWHLDAPIPLRVSQPETHAEEPPR